MSNYDADRCLLKRFVRPNHTMRHSVSGARSCLWALLRFVAKYHAKTSLLTSLKEDNTVCLKRGSAKF